ncbi:hypothetical protein COU91_04250 [Candidatus Saccharibacteria bacterium CG10_big_fil_rev_8_21_14_0_10_47_8]|nr:MAG: hypothetical protein COU91_04250 [Candidatus Saccharibacteria bacterium CG10_big_fil_rev_8_21_14_0_10_47_8]
MVRLNNRSSSTTSTTPASTAAASCAPTHGETTFSGKVAYNDQYKQYTLQTPAGRTYYLQTTAE